MTAILRGHLVRAIDRSSPDELRVIAHVADSLARRRDKHGSLDLARSPDLFAELHEGLVDALIAVTAMTIRAEDLRVEQERRAALLAGAAEDERAEAHGVPGRVGLLRGYGNAIVPQVAATFIRAALEATRDQAELALEVG